MLGFVGDVHQFGNAGLHAEGHLVLAYLGGDLGIAQGCVAGEVELVDRVDEGALVFCGYAFGVAQVEHGVAFAVKMNALVLAGEKTAVPLAGCDGLVLASSDGGENDETGEVLGVRAESVKNPGAHAGASGYLGPRVHVGVGGVVVDLFGMHGTDDANVVCDRSDFWKLVGDELAGLSVALEFVLGAEAFECVLLAHELGDRLTFGDGFGHGFAVHFPQLGFVIVGLEVGGTASHA